MRMSFKYEMYFVIEFENSSDKELVSRGVRDVLEPEFDKLIKKIKLSKTDKENFKKLSGINPEIRIVPKREYLEQIAQK